MKVAVISDTHFGYGAGTEREEDSFRQAEEAFDRALEMDVDLILLPGDVFDKKTPKPETWSRALRILKKPLLKKNKEVEVEEPERGKEKLSERSVPVVAIHGTHERRSKGYVNPIEMLEDAGYLIHIHCEKAVLDVNGERIAVHGISGVPEEYVKSVLEKYDPKPVDGTPNIFMFHQSLEEYIYDPDSTFMKADDLPEGFDLYIDGHIHWHNELKDHKNILFPGSTVMTQMRKIEAEKDKGFYVVDTDTWSKEFVPLKTARPFKYIEVELEGEKTSEVIDLARERIKEALENINSDRKPLVKLKLRGESSKAEVIHVDVSEIKKGFDAVISIDKEFKGRGLRSQIESLRKSQREKKSIRQMGMDRLKEMIEDSDYNSIDPEELIGILSEKEPTRVVDRIMDSQDELKRKSESKKNKKEVGNKTLKDF